MADSGANSLRDYIEQLDPDLGRRAHVLWQRVRPMQERQTEPGKSDSGPSHCETVELHILRFLRESGYIDDYSAPELFLLSCAACCHDVGKAFQDRLDKATDHGGVSGSYVYTHRGELVLKREEAIAVDLMVSIHSLQGDQYKRALRALPSAHPLHTGPVDLQRLALLLKAGDVLHTDYTRVPEPAIRPEDHEAVERKKMLARECSLSWRIENQSVVVTAYPETPDQVAALLECQRFMQDREWGPIIDELRAHDLPHELRFENLGRYLVQPTGGPRGRELPGMYPYSERDAALFAGRESDIRELFSLILAYPASLLVGPSGVGKSSLIQAGLVPQIKALSDWRCVVTRPDKGRFFAPFDFAGLVVGTPAPDASFTSLCREALERSEANELLVVLDQFEDAAYFGLLDEQAIVEELSAVLRELPEVRLVFSYRDDVESILGPLWIQLAHSPQGLPRHNLNPLRREGARSAIENLLGIREVGLEPAEEVMNRVVDGLVMATERHAEGAGDLVYPPFIQMVVDQLCVLAQAGIVNKDALGSTGTERVERMIADYLERSVGRVEEKGHAKEHARRVLVAVVRTAGKRAVASTERIEAESQVPPDKVRSLLRDMAVLRLVRPRPDDRWEIAHDLLAQRVVDRFTRKGDRRFKQAREALQTKALSYSQHHGVPTADELRDLWLNRQKVPPHSLSDHERVSILAGMWAASTRRHLASLPDMEDTFELPFEPDAGEAPGWYWLCDRAVDRMIALCRATLSDPDPVVAASAATCIGLIGGRSELAVLRQLLARPWPVWVAAYNAFLRLATPSDLPELRAQVRDAEPHARAVAAEALARFAVRKDLPLLRAMLSDSDRVVQWSAADAFERLAEPADLPLLRKMASGSDATLRAAAARAMRKLATPDDSDLLREMTTDLDGRVRQAAIRALGSLKAVENRAVLERLLSVDDEFARREAAEALVELGDPHASGPLSRAANRKDGSGGHAFSCLIKLLSHAPLSLMRQYARSRLLHERQGAASALGAFSCDASIGLLRKLAMDRSTKVRCEAVWSLTRRKALGALPVFLKCAKDRDAKVRRAAVEGLGQLGAPESLWILRHLARSDVPAVQAQAIRGIAALCDSSDLPWLMQAAQDESVEVRVAVTAALTSLGDQKAVDALVSLLDDPDCTVREASSRALGSILPRDALDVIARMALSDHSEVRCVVEDIICPVANPRGSAVGGAELLVILTPAMLDARTEVSADASRVVARALPPDRVVSFLDRYQVRLTTQALSVFDWYLYAPEYLREAYEARRAEETDPHA
jgi:HEAT repeat protein